jgi:voltage-gated potassium channel
VPTSARADRSAKQLTIAVLVLFLTIVAGAAGYMFFEGWNLGDALYMTLISLTTTGFAEVRPLSPAGRGVTVFVIVSGIASLAYVGGRVLQLAVELYLFRRGRMERKINRMRNHVILCGYGRMGRHIASDLAEAKVPFVVIEASEEMVPTLEEHGHAFAVGDASSDEILRRVGVERARGLIAVVTSDAENVYTTLTARALNPNITIVARALTDESEPKLRTAGANRVIKPYELVGRRIAQLVIRPAMVEFVETIARSRTGEITMEEILVGEESPLVGLKLRNTDIRSRLNIIVVAIRRGESDFDFNPGPDAVIAAGDRLTAIGSVHDLAELSTLCGASA